MNATVRRQYGAASGILSPNCRQALYAASPDAVWLCANCILSQDSRKGMVVAWVAG